MFKSLLSFLEQITPGLLKTQQRAAVVFHSDADSGELDHFIADLPQASKLILSSNMENALPCNRASTKLGEEYELVIFDARESFNPDALGIVSGVLCGGGCLLVILPGKEIWLEQKSLFYKHVNTLLSGYQGVYYFDNEDDDVSSRLTNVDTGLIDKGCSDIGVTSPYRSIDQQCAVEEVSELLNREKECCVVVTSGRGRGKSSALGLVSAKLIAEKNCNILITAPRLSVADPVFQRIEQQCPNGKASRAEFKYMESGINFIAPDALLDELPVADILLVDEAAAIPLSMLGKLLTHYPKIVFSTTTHGYEGTGRGFILKFYKLLDEVRADWKKLELHQPIRWSINDPLEKWIEELLFLNLKLDVKPETPSVIEDCKVALIDRQLLLEDKEKLSSVFSLLVVAHYRTSPADFQYLLDSENIRIYSIEYKNQPLGVLVINQEGGFDAELSSAIYRGERRPKGNLLAQTLCFHAGYEQAASLKYARVMRIAIHPEIQQSGFGSYLFKKVMQMEADTGVDVIGSSFSATVPLLNFWEKAGLSILRFGFSRDHVTASHSAVVAKSLSLTSAVMVEELTKKYKRNFNLWLTGPLSDLSVDIKKYNLDKNYISTDDVDEIDIRDIESFANHNRNYEPCMPAIIRWINQFSELPCGLSESDKQMLKASMQYKNNWKAIVNELGLTGKSEAINTLRSALNHLQKVQ